MAATLYAVPASHPCAAVEKALQLKGIEYRRVDIPPVAHKAVQYALFGGWTVPGLVLDGEKVLGSRAIVRALERHAPEPPLLPAEEKERKSVELAEQWGDEALQPIVRRVLWAALRRAPEAMPSYGKGSRLPIPDGVQRLVAPFVAAAEVKINDASDLNVRADLRALPHHLARVDRWIEHGVVLGERPNAADLQIGAGLALLATVEDVVTDHTAWELARRWFPGYPGRVPAGVMPAEWLHERTSTAH